MSKSKILVIDDDPELPELLAVILNRVGGYDVQQENRPFAAVATARNFLQISCCSTWTCRARTAAWFPPR